jgi:hypothetical protein
LLARLLLQKFYCNISCWTDWNSTICLSVEAINDLEEWQAGLAKWNGHVALVHQFDVVLKTDASLSGWGAALKGLSATSAGWW